MRLRNILIFSVFLFIIGCYPARTPQNPSSSETQSPTAIENKGSDTMVNLALAWAEAYQTIHPEIRISVTGGGTGTGIAALINGTVDFANASRGIKPEEETSAIRNGIQPVEHIVARDAIAIIVHPENPVTQLTLRQISDIYSGVINNWQEVGGEDRVIVRLSRETNSGTHIYFLEEVLRLGNQDNKTLFSVDTLLLPSSQGITAEVSDNPNAIGYDGLGYVTPDVKIIEVAPDENSPYVMPSTTTVNNGSYPVARDLYIYTDGEPAGDIGDYLNWILSPKAQKIVFDLGFVPIDGNDFSN